MQEQSECFQRMRVVLAYCPLGDDASRQRELSRLAQYNIDLRASMVYGAVEPKTGESFFLELPWLNAQNFQVFLDEFSSMYRDTLNIVVLDNGRFHKAGALKIPENVVCVFLPPYSPELNPIERLWENMKCNMAWKLFGNVEEQQNYVAIVLNSYDAQKIHSLTSYPYFVHAVNALCS